MIQTPPLRFTAYAAMSIDRWIGTDPTKLPEWTSLQDKTFLAEHLREVDARVMGRNTYEAAKSRLAGKTVFVFTSGEQRQEGTVTFLNPAKSDLRRAFAPFKRVAILGGGRVYQTMLEKGYLHEFFLTIEPIVLGNGIPLFSGGLVPFRMHLVSMNQLNADGTILLQYRPKR